jgi:hypothetical protein
MLDRSIMSALTFIDKKLMYDHGVVKEGGLSAYDAVPISTNFNQVVMVIPATHRSM